VINAGVASYSPTVYLFQYRKALQASVLATGHTVVVGLDISDVQDEAGYWIDGNNHPRKRDDELAFRRRLGISVGQSWHWQISTWFPLVGNVIEWFRKPSVNDATLDATVFQLTRSAFTWADWATLDQTRAYLTGGGYAPLGVAGGLARVEAKLSDLVALAHDAGARVYVLIYPWPAQVRYPDRFDWSAHVRSMCARLFCDGVIDVIPAFRTLAKTEPDWYRTYYLFGDSHFTVAGNRVVADRLLEALK